MGITVEFVAEQPGDFVGEVVIKTEMNVLTLTVSAKVLPAPNDEDDAAAASQQQQQHSSSGGTAAHSGGGGAVTLPPLPFPYSQDGGSTGGGGGSNPPSARAQQQHTSPGSRTGTPVKAVAAGSLARGELPGVPGVVLDETRTLDEVLGRVPDGEEGEEGGGAAREEHAGPGGEAGVGASS